MSAGSDRSGPTEEPTLPLPSATPPPSRRGYLIAAIIALLGLIIGVAGLLRGFGQLADKVESFQRVDVPGNGLVQFAEAGDFTIYYELTGTGAVSLPSVEIGLMTEAGEPVPLRDYEGSFDYNVDGYEGSAVATFHIDAPGTYVLASAGDIPAGLAELAVGKSLSGTLAATLVPGLLLFVALVAATVVAIVTAVRRRRVRRRLAVPQP